MFITKQIFYVDDFLKAKYLAEKKSPAKVKEDKRQHDQLDTIKYLV